IGAPITGYARKNDTIIVSTKNIRWVGETTCAWLLSSHDIDLVRWFFGSEPVEARAYGRKEFLPALGVPTYDMIQAQVKFANGAFVTFESGWIYPNTFPTNVDSYIQLVGSAGTVLLDRKRESLEVSTEKSFSYPKNFLSAEVFGRMRGAFPSCLEDFAYAILKDQPPKVTGFDGRQVTAALEAIHESLARDGETVRVKQPDDDILSWSKVERQIARASIACAVLFNQHARALVRAPPQWQAVWLATRGSCPARPAQRRAQDQGSARSGRLRAHRQYTTGLRQRRSRRR